MESRSSRTIRVIVVEAVGVLDTDMYSLLSYQVVMFLEHEECGPLYKAKRKGGWLAFEALCD